MGFERSVFLNCPFDDAYRPLLRPILFVIFDLGFTPRITLERLDSGGPRIEKIISLIRESKYAIHDLSRLKARKAGEYYRLNMPFELGLDVGCRLFRSDRWAEKKCLILEAERYRYQAALSDMSNSDIAVHGNDPVEASSQVRNWLANEAGLRAPGPTGLWGRFIDFMAENYAALRANGHSERDIERLPIPELMTGMQDWIANNRRSGD
jgi:hypothetical protein